MSTKTDDKQYFHLIGNVCMQIMGSQISKRGHLTVGTHLKTMIPCLHVTKTKIVGFSVFKSMRQILVPLLVICNG